ncbi:MAG: response regulator [Mariprofundus sp.]|nr:response regulator [Mariprofundus sp.]
MRYITTGKAAALCGVGINSIKRWIQKGELQCVITPGGHWRIAEDEFQQFLDRLQSKQIQPKQIKPKPLEPPQAAKQVYKVLLIEDDHALSDLIEAAFHLAEFDTVFDSAGDGYAGLMKIGAMQPDLLILDIMLPEINGLELIQRIRTSNICPAIRIVVITGAADRRPVKRALDKASPDAVFHKPFATEALLATVHELLHEKQQLAGSLA